MSEAGRVTDQSKGADKRMNLPGMERKSG
jgi:hypothetical protein